MPVMPRYDSPTMLRALPLVALFALTGCAWFQPATPSPPPRPTFVYPAAERMVVELSPEERSYLLNEMRYYLDLVWIVNESLAKDDLATVSIVAHRRAQLSAAARLPPEFDAKLPTVFRLAWRETNRQIDEMAVYAGSSEATPKSVLARMGAVMQRCNECHTLYQFHAK